jgi:ribosomal protein S18 acetylase RimI-like enzyme
MIRPTNPEETPILMTLAEGTGVFKPFEIEALEEVLDEYHAHAHEIGHRSITYEDQGKAIGFAYYAPAAMTVRTWYLYWIAVSKQIQAKGVGGKLLKHAEDDIRQQNGRLLLIETSSLPHYGLTRQFYVKHKYEQAAVIKDFYADGDDLVVFRKKFQ